MISNYHFTALVELDSGFDNYNQVIRASSRCEAIGCGVLIVLANPDYKNAKILKANAIQIN
ncbi:PfWMP4_05 [Phormidium phage Pf-WMP4]|uniref:PfWMP4_05 n=1 Tax=Phormidium phage Pf-WMP4 TaxID=2913979 RepID=Q0GBW1_9CAUD|nr:PfWMP4_05 [Phormidium phage Pf-WMP4]ABI33149.1 PfWMP4_05 [Phormidium phage Pf-WMP4]